MKGVNTLIRFAKRTLDELRKKQVLLETQKAQLLEAIRKLHEDLASEQRLAQKTVEMATFYGGFAKRIKEKEAKMREEIRRLDEELARLSEEIMAAFADLKKYEIARDNAIAREKAEAARKETLMLDEIASTKFIRRQKEEG